MPAPIDWTPAGGLAAVQVLTVAVGPREAARRLNLSDAHSEALRRICSRQGWLSGGQAQPVSPRLAGVPTQPLQSRPAVPIPPPDALAALAAVRVERANVPVAVPTAADALSAANADNSRRTRSALLRYSAKVSEHVADLPADEALAAAPLVSSVAKTAATAGDWAAAQPSTTTIQLLSVGGESADVGGDFEG